MFCCEGELGHALGFDRGHLLRSPKVVLLQALAMCVAALGRLAMDSWGRERARKGEEDVCPATRAPTTGIQGGAYYFIF